MLRWGSRLELQACQAGSGGVGRGVCVESRLCLVAAAGTRSFAAKRVPAADTVQEGVAIGSIAIEVSSYCRPTTHCSPGLPEEVSHTKQALARGYAVIAIDSSNREYTNRCYS